MQNKSNLQRTSPRPKVKVYGQSKGKRGTLHNSWMDGLNVMTPLKNYLEDAAHSNGFISADEYVRRVAAVKYYYSIERFVEEFLRQLQGYSPQELQLLEWNNKEWHKMLSRIPLKLTFMKLVLTDRKEESRKMFARTVMQRLKDIEKSQSWLSKQIGLSREGVRQIMMGQWLPQPECIERMEKALNMKIVIQKKTPLRKRYNRTPRKHSTSREGSAPLHTTAAVDSLEGDSYDSRY